MNTETKRIIIAACSGFMIGRTVEQYKIMRKRTMALRKFNNGQNQDFWSRIQKYLNDPNDDRTIEQLVDDWQTSLKFHKIVNEQD